jgi:tetratricopeptide (TPR) repeat protein
MSRSHLPRLSSSAWGAFIVVCCQHLVSAAPTSALDVSINWNPEKADREDAIWLGYLAARAAYIDRHMDLYEQKIGVITPTFAEEVQARSAAAKIYRELQQKDHDLHVAYFDDLSLVASNSFMREYAWTYLHQATWGTAPNDLRLAGFEAWRKTNLANHQAMTKGSIGFSAKAKPEAAKSETPTKEYTLLIEGRKVLRQGNPQRAMADYFDPVIAHFETIYKGTDKRIYSAQNSLQMFIYLALPNEKKQSVEVLDTVWADAYLLKAYALTELNRIKDAQGALEAAIGLSPMNSQYFSELAYTYQVQKDCDKSIATYEQAASVAEFGSDDESKTNDLTRAWRGQGYCLVEQGKWNEAEAMYRKCLALDPKDNKAQGELDYIERQRKH